MSRESRFIGYLVLGFGVLAVVAVLVLALGGGEAENNTRDTAQQSANARDLMSDLAAAPVQTQPAPVKDLFFERDADFDAGDMEGDWQASIGRYTAVLQIRKDVYQLILASPDPVAPRFYSSGTFKVIEDIIMLSPRRDWPAPKSNGNVAYSQMTQAPFPVIARIEDGKLLWQNVPQSERRVTAPYTSPLFMSENVKLATWQKLK